MGDGRSSMECNGGYDSRILSPNSWAWARKYVAMSVMGSMALDVPPVRIGCGTRCELLASSAESVGTRLAQIAGGMYFSMNLDGQVLSFNLESRSMP